MPYWDEMRGRSLLRRQCGHGQLSSWLDPSSEEEAWQHDCKSSTFINGQKELKTKLFGLEWPEIKTKLFSPASSTKTPVLPSAARSLRTLHWPRTKASPNQPTTFKGNNNKSKGSLNDPPTINGLWAPISPLAAARLSIICPPSSPATAPALIVGL